MQVQRLRSVEADTHHDRVVQQSNVDQIVAEKQRLEAQVTSLNKDRVALEAQLQEVSGWVILSE